MPVPIWLWWSAPGLAWWLSMCDTDSDASGMDRRERRNYDRLDSVTVEKHAIEQ